MIQSIEGYVGSKIDSLLKPVNECWQPSDFLPNMESDQWHDQVLEMRKASQALPDDLLVVLVGDMVTEEALPSYQTWINRLNGVTDQSGVSQTAWARWSRGWTSEENRHGDLLNKYLYLTGRVNMRAIEVTIQNLISEGFNPQTENDPYLGFIYTSFQERATKISHRNVAKLALKAGDEKLHQICGIIAGDEARHELAYKLFMTKVFEADPVDAVQSFATMMKKKITMPAVAMHDGNDRQLFTKFSKVAQKTKVYTVLDYAEIVNDLVAYWKVESLNGLSGVAAKAQDYLCTLSERYIKLADRMNFEGTEQFSWIHDRAIVL